MYTARILERRVSDSIITVDSGHRALDPAKTRALVAAAYEFAR